MTGHTFIDAVTAVQILATSIVPGLSETMCGMQEPVQELGVYGVADGFFAPQGKKRGILAGFRGVL